MLQSQNLFVGYTTLCLLEKIYEDGTLALRNQYNSPGVDSLVFAECNGKKVKIGEFYKVKIIGLEGIDLKGELL